MPRFKLTIAYDGRPWKGWQAQPSGQTVQDRIETVLGMLVGKRMVIHGSGRTDSGVHARGQVAHFTVENLAWTSETWLRAVNSKLPESIRILHCEEVPLNFHSRYHTTGKVYEYRLWHANVMSPFEVGLSWHFFGSMDVNLLREGAAILQGRHNFSRLSANRGDMTEDARRENIAGVTRDVRRIEVFEEGEVIRIEFEGDGFLYKMVRLMVGSLVRVARGRADVEWLRSLVEEPQGLKSDHCAPADGLYLLRVMYPGSGVLIQPEHLSHDCGHVSELA